MIEFLKNEEFLDLQWWTSEIQKFLMYVKNPGEFFANKMPLEFARNRILCQKSLMNERREGELLGCDDEGGVRRGSPFVWPSSSHTAAQPPRAARAIGPLSLGGGGTSCPSLAPYPHYTVYVRMNCSLPALAHMPASALPVARTLWRFDHFNLLESRGLRHLFLFSDNVY